jgi:hypothetical protein
MNTINCRIQAKIANPRAIYVVETAAAGVKMVYSKNDMAAIINTLVMISIMPQFLSDMAPP